MKKTTVLIPLAFGDEGKGAWTEYFAVETDADISIRYNGGCQGYHYIRYNGQPHPANQFSAASLARPHLRTYIGRQVPVSPVRLLQESFVMGGEKYGLSNQNQLSRIFMSVDSPFVTSAHDLLCETRETFSEHRIGTAGIGIRELMADIAAGNEGKVFRAGDLISHTWNEKFASVTMSQLDKIMALNAPVDVLKGKIDKYNQEVTLRRDLWDCHRVAFEVGGILDETKFSQALRRKNIIFEPAQGTLLDRDFGFIPHVTSTTTTAEPIWQYHLSPKKTRYVALCRAFMTRHGPGLFPTETDELNFPDDNGTHEFQGPFRFGWLDLVLLRYAVAVNSQFVDLDSGSLAISHLDQLSGLAEIKVCIGYTHNLPDSARRHFEFDDSDRIRGIRPSRKTTAEIAALLASCQPEYLAFPGWTADLRSCKSLTDLPKQARVYLDFISGRLGLPIRHIAIGPRLEDRFEIAP